MVVALWLPGVSAAQTQGSIPFPDTLVTLDLHEDSARLVIEELARLAGVNVLFGEGADSSVSGTFTEVPMDQVVESILKSAQLEWCQQGQVLTITPPSSASAN